MPDAKIYCPYARDYISLGRARKRCPRCGAIIPTGTHPTREAGARTAAHVEPETREQPCAKCGKTVEILTDDYTEGAQLREAGWQKDKDGWKCGECFEPCEDCEPCTYCDGMEMRLDCDETRHNSVDCGAHDDETRGRYRGLSRRGRRDEPNTGSRTLPRGDEPLCQAAGRAHLSLLQPQGILVQDA